MATQMIMATLAFADSNAKDQRLLEHGKTNSTLDLFGWTPTVQLAHVKLGLTFCDPHA